MVILQHDSFCYFHPPLSTVTWADSALPWHFWTNTGGTRRVMSAVFSLAAYVSSIRLTGQFGSVKQPDSADLPRFSPHPKRHITLKTPPEIAVEDETRSWESRKRFGTVSAGARWGKFVCLRSFFPVMGEPSQYKLRSLMTSTGGATACPKNIKPFVPTFCICTIFTGHMCHGDRVLFWWPVCS